MEAAHVICVELADGFYHNVKSAQMYGREMTGAIWECFIAVRLGLGGLRDLSSLGQMPLQIFYQNRTVSSGFCKCEAWPRGIVSNFHCSEPRGENGESCTGMQIANEGGYTR